MKTAVKKNGKKPSFKPFHWTIIKVLTSKIKPTPNNFKLKTEVGLARFNHSVEKYGRAGAIILNKDLTIINGNTNWEKAKELGEKFVYASVPDRQLSAKEFLEFAAMFDQARAGEVDILRIQEELGTSDDFFRDWHMPIPEKALAAVAEMEKKEHIINPTASRKIDDIAKEIETSRVTLLFKPSEAQEFLNIAESLYQRFKVDNVTDLSLKVFKYVKKGCK